MSDSHGGHGGHGGGHGHEAAGKHELDQRILQLPTIFEIEEVVHAKEGEETIQVADTVSAAAALYEKLRNVLEYEEEHRLRRNAIRRVLKRRIGVDVESWQLAKDVITELIWARYLPNNTIPIAVIDTVAAALVKYNPLVAAVSRSSNPSLAFDFILDLMAIDVESHVAPPTREDALASFAYRILQEKIEWKKGSLSEDERELQLYLAVYRTLLKADAARLRSRVFLLYHPDWKTGHTNEEIAARLDQVIATVDGQIKHPIAERLSREVRKFAVLFNVLFDVVAKNPQEFLSAVGDSAELDKLVGKAAAARIHLFQSRKARRVFRAVAFLFVTKMLLALVIELPYDLVIAHETSMLPLAVNIVFPPLLLAFIALTAQLNIKLHVKTIQKGVRSIAFGTQELNMIFKVTKGWNQAFTWTFGLLYAFSFIFVFGFIGTLLIGFGFNIVSMSIFLLFLTLVTFFGLQIRQSIKEVVVDRGRTGIIGALIDWFMLPIVRVGRWISIRTPRINVFIFFMDFIIEAPFKLAIEVIEGWMAFVREKKEELE